MGGNDMHIDTDKTKRLDTMISVLLTITDGSLRHPHSISPTSTSVVSNESVAKVTAVGSSHIKGGSRRCVHCSIGGISEVNTVNSYSV